MFKKTKLVKRFYYQHFDELDNDHRFHFATRIKNFFKVNDFDEYLKQNIPSTDLIPIFKNNDCSKVNFYKKRKPFFEKYDHLYAIEAMLFRVNHLKNEYNIDVRDDFLKLVPLEKLYKLSDDLLCDDEALVTLSTFAINVICLTEILFPRGQNVIKKLAQKSLDQPTQNQLTIYLNTHIILCDTNFYTTKIHKENRKILKKLLMESAEIINQNYDETSLDIKLEFLVCAKLVGVNFLKLKHQIKHECSKNLKNGILTDSRKPARLNTLNGAEHRNVLYIMSNL